MSSTLTDMAFICHRTGLGYLLFENYEHKESWSAPTISGRCLNGSGVPLMILDACQTAQPDKTNPFGSVAAKLIDALLRSNGAEFRRKGA